MSQWDSRVSSHVVWAELEALGVAIDQALEREGIDLETIAGLERLRAVITVCGKRLASTDPILIDPRSLNTIGNALATAKGEVASFVSNGNGAHVTNANVRADDIIASLGSIPSPVSSDDFVSINEAATAYRTTIERHLHTVLARVKELEAASTVNASKISNIEASLNAEQQRLAGLISEHQSQFSTAQDKRASDFSAIQAEQQAKFVAAMADQQTLFSTDQDARKTAFADSSRDSQEKFASLISDYSQKLKDHDRDFSEGLEKEAQTHKENLEELKTGYQVSAAEILKEVVKHKTDVENLVGVIGNLAVTSGYLKVANHARKMLYLWQGLTVLSLGGLIAVAFFMAFPSVLGGKAPERELNSALSGQIQKETTKNETQTVAKEGRKAEGVPSAQVSSGSVSDAGFYQGFATRVFLSLTFGIFAAYAARQATHFFETEQRNRRRALELEALGPFIEPLDKEMKDKFRLQIGERSFAVPDNESQKPKEDEPVTALSVLKSKEISEFITNIVKAVKS